MSTWPIAFGSHTHLDELKKTLILASDPPIGSSFLAACCVRILVNAKGICRKETSKFILQAAAASNTALPPLETNDNTKGVAPRYSHVRSVKMQLASFI